jgi:ribonuclease-3
LRDLGTRELEKRLIDFLLPVEKALNYEFKDKFVLLEAFTHKSFKEYHGLSVQYERLEVLGDAVLDYIANSNLIKYTILEKYNV